MKKEVLIFDLYGRTAFFKQNDVNQYCYYTYSHIHKPFVLGFLGGILGLDGKKQQKFDEDYPEYYRCLKDLGIAIIPSKVNFLKKIQIFNNTVGYANAGQTLNVRQQWLENVSWTIYLIQNDISDDIWSKLKESILEHKSIYGNYLGDNSHFGNRRNVKLEMVELLDNFDDTYKIDSIFPYNLVGDIGDGDLESTEDMSIYKETLPIALDKETNLYLKEKMCYTKCYISDIEDTNNLYKYGNKVLYFI